MTKIDIVSGFLGAGKTTLIKKLLKEALNASKVVLIENEFGEIGIDGGFLKEAGIEIKEMNSGCICCSLVGDFGASLKEVLEKYEPDRILIEPSGVGKLSDVMKAVQRVEGETGAALNSAVAVVDASKCRMYCKNFGEFFLDQIAHAGTVILSRTGSISEEKLQAAVALIREHNAKATVITTPWEQLGGTDILHTIEGASDLEAELMAQVKKKAEHDHCHHEHEEGESGCHHRHDGEEHCHHEHEEEKPGCHHRHYEEEHCHHEHEEGEPGCRHRHGEEAEHDHHHGHYEHRERDGHEHHHADEVFTSWGIETPATFTKAEIETILGQLGDEEQYGLVLRAKGMVPSGAGNWVYFDYVPDESEVRDGKPDVTGKICVIGSKLKENALQELFGGKE